MTPPRVFQFADIEFDVHAGELRRGGSTVRLEPQPARVLALLVERAGVVVGREELQQHVWSSDTFVDFEHGLNYCIARIRTALGDSASEPRFIETLPRRGYRFIAPVHELVAGNLQGGSTATPSAPDAPAAPGGGASIPLELAAPRQTRTLENPKLDLLGQVSGLASERRGPRPSLGRRPARTAAWRGGAAAAAVAVALIAVVAWMVAARRGADSRQSGRVRIAVVPFDNETGVGEYDRLAQTLTDATVARLAADPDRLEVIGNASILRARRDARDLLAIGEALGVRHVVLGQVQHIEGRLRITVHLIRVPDQAHVWAQRFEPSAGELSDLDRSVPEAVAGAVVRRLLGG